ncbi:MAG: BatA domain-containing protein [Kiritimatiellae bacterium]|nr:BatA domain-containing protein [Kiritimatiellia bacterium]
MFGSPMFLWALLAAGIPLMLHMFQRRRTVNTPFPTIRFLKAAQKRSSSRVRFENFLLWLLRTALLAALALAFAQPVLRNVAGADSFLGRSRRDVAIVLDGSYSMNYELDRGKVWSLCKDAAVQIVQALHPGDRVCVYLATDTAVPVIEKPTTEYATVVSAIQSLSCAHVSSKLGETVAAALRTLGAVKEKTEKEVFVLTDGQALSWEDFRASSKKGDEDAGEAIPREARDKVAFFALLAGAASPENAFPSFVKVSPPLMLQGQSARVAVRIGRTGAPKPVTVTLKVDGQEQGSRSVTAEPGTETSVEFVLNNLEAGIHVASVSTPKDALAEDDVFQFLLRVNHRLPVLVVGRHEATRYLRAALAPGAADDSIRQVTPDALDAVELRDFQAVFFCDALPLSGQTVLRIETYVQNGGVAVFFPGETCDPSAYAVFNILPAQPGEVASVATADAARFLRRLPRKEGQKVDFTLPLPPGTMPTVALKRILRIAGEPAEEAATLVTAGEGMPFLLGRAAGRGRCFLFTVGATREWSTFPLTAFFVPVVHQLIRQGSGASVQPAHVTLGTSMAANEAIPNYREEDTVTMPSGAPLQVKESGGRNLILSELPEPGIYLRTKAGGTDEPVLAVNTDRSESKLDPASQDDVAEWTGFKKCVVATDAEELARLVEERRNGRSFTELVLWLALLLSLAEWGFANAALRSRKGATENLAVSVTGKVTGG